MKYGIFISLLFLTFSASSVAAQTNSKMLAELPFELHKNLIILKVKINGFGPLNMMLDTGTDSGVIDLKAAKRIGLRLTSEGKPVAGSGTSANAAYDTTFPRLDVGKWKVKNLEAAAVDLSAIGKAIGIELHGILGHNLLDKRIVEIDFPARTVRFYSEINNQKTGNKTSDFNQTILPFRYANDSVLVEDVYINGRKITTLFDTGFNGTFNVMPASIEKLELEKEFNDAKPVNAVGYNGQSTNREGTIKTVKVGNFTVDSPTVIFWEKNTGHDSQSYGFTIGNGFLKDFKVTLNYPANIIVLEKTSRSIPDKSDLENPFQIGNKYVKQNNYITPIFELKSKEEQYLASPVWKSSYLEMMILLYGYVGDYKEAYRYDAMLFETFPAAKQIGEMYKRDVADMKSTPIADHKMIGAIEAIESAAEKQQVIMINEEHRTPFHRALTLQILPALYEQGFRYFAVETLYEKDAEQLNERKFPTQETGFYTADPVFASAIREALRLGYKLVPYESIDRACKVTAENPGFCQDKRERGQAQNIYDRILKNDPQAKILVHVGRGHNSKTESSNEFNFMGFYFHQISKIEPFTIDQLRFSEHPNSAYEHPLYRFLTKNVSLQKPSVFQSTSGKFFHHSDGYDLTVFHPRMNYKNGRAAFLEMNGDRQAKKINLKKLKLKSQNGAFDAGEPFLIQAFYANEITDAVPVDQIILYPDKEIPALMLPKGKFLFRAMDKSGTVHGEYQKQI